MEAEEAAHLTQLASVFYYSYHERETKMYAKKEPGDLLLNKKRTDLSPHPQVMPKDFLLNIFRVGDHYNCVFP